MPTMKTYCIICKKNAANENSNVRATTQKRLLLSSNCAICGKKTDFNKKSRTPQF